MKKITTARYFELFETLGPIKGVLCYKRIETAAIKPDVFQIIKPLIEEMQEAKENLTFEEFCGAMDALLKVLTPQEKNLLVFGDKKNKSPISSRSQSPNKLVLDTHDRLLKHKKNLEDKLKYQKLNKESEMSNLNVRQKLEFDNLLNFE